MQEYHYAWLSVHRNRTEEWLKERIADGFDLHHIDGDHFNDDPYNLALIECTDHMRLHGSSLNRLLAEPRERRALQALDAARMAYEMKNNTTSWRIIGQALRPDSLQPSAWARATAKNYAEQAGLPFPKPDANIPGYARRAA